MDMGNDHWDAVAKTSPPSKRILDRSAVYNEYEKYDDAAKYGNDKTPFGDSYYRTEYRHRRTCEEYSLLALMDFTGWKSIYHPSSSNLC